MDEQLSARPPVEIQKVKKIKQKKINKLRYAEYYDQQELLDNLYKDSQNGAIFDKLMKHIVSDANIMMAYTPEGRKWKHDNLMFRNAWLLGELYKYPVRDRSIEYNDNRVSLFSAQRGRCAITGRDFLCQEEIHCHHKTPRAKGGKDGYNNLVLILEDVHKLVHSTKKSTIDFYLGLLKLNDKQLKKLNHLRELAGLPAISQE